MSSVCSLLSEEHFLCSICLDIFTDPVSTPCGHNFCKNCISHHWNVSVPCQCPLCSKVFNPRPELHVNTFISEMAAQFRCSAVRTAIIHSVQKSVSSGDVLCDVCSEAKAKALKSCLTCLTSYCEAHLEPHHRIPGLRRHQLIDPVENLEERICKKHDRPLEMFCRTDRMCVCHFCTESSHRQHVFVLMREEYEVRRDELMKSGAEIQRNVEKRQLKIQQIRRSVKLSRKDADRETATGVEIFTTLIQNIQSRLAQLLDSIEQKQKKLEEQAEGYIKTLEDEISELMKKDSEIQKLSCTEDLLQFFQNCSSLSITPTVNKWKDIRVHSSHEGTMKRALAQLRETFSERMEMCPEFWKIQQCFVDVTLDPNTASPYLILSEDLKQVRSSETQQNLPDNPERFNICNGVLGKQRFCSGKFYYEVLVKGKTDWDLGVATESIIRKGKIRLSPKSGFWTVWLRNSGGYKALAGPGVPLSLKSKPERVGVFVDYEEGLVSFYDADTEALMFSYTGCNFNEEIVPYFSPCSASQGTNTAPLIILPPPTQASLNNVRNLFS